MREARVRTEKGTDLYHQSGTGVPAPAPVTPGCRRRKPGTSVTSTAHQVVNEVPQPQEDLAFGFSNLNPAPVTVER